MDNIQDRSGLKGNNIPLGHVLSELRQGLSIHRAVSYTFDLGEGLGGGLGEGLGVGEGTCSA